MSRVGLCASVSLWLLPPSALAAHGGTEVAIAVESIVVAAGGGAGVGGPFHPVVELGAGLALCLGVVAGVGDVVLLVGVLFQVVQLLRRPLFAGEAEKWGDLRIGPAAGDDVLARTPVDVAERPDREPGLRVAGGPEVGAQVADVEVPVH